MYGDLKTAKDRENIVAKNITGSVISKSQSNAVEFNHKGVTELTELELFKALSLCYEKLMSATSPQDDFYVRQQISIIKDELSKRR